MERDRNVTQRLTEQGWRVMRVWESDVKNDMTRAADLIVEVVKRDESPSANI